MMALRTAVCVVLLSCMATVGPLYAQLSLSGQLRTRSELRNGQGMPAVADTTPAFFTSQRTRLSVDFTGHRFRLHTVVQDVRVWGQEASTVNRVTPPYQNGLMVHEAWGEISLLDTGSTVREFSLRLGRQELDYDDARLLGNLDWLQQARRHDAVLLRFAHKGITAHLGAAFNQNEERKASVIYNGVPTGYPAGTNGIGVMYRSMQFLYAAKKFRTSTASVLFFKDDFSKYDIDHSDPLAPKPVFRSGTWSRYTMGSHFTGSLAKRITVTGDAFYQTGRYRDGTSLKEYFFSGSVMYAHSRRFSVGGGADLTSGNNGADPSARFQRFDPLYGTPHKFWGYMDYFYVADGFGSNGLLDIYLRSRFTPGPKSFVTLDVHRFSLPDAVVDEQGMVLDKWLGLEFDLTASFALTSAISLEGGYSYMRVAPTMYSAQVKNVPGASPHAQWAWLMIIIKPSFTIYRPAGQ